MRNVHRDIRNSHQIRNAFNVRTCPRFECVIHMSLIMQLLHEYNCLKSRIRLTRPNEPDAKPASEVGNARNEIALGNELAGGLPLLLVLGIPGRQLDLGKDPSLGLLDAFNFGLLALRDLGGIVGLLIGSLGSGADDGLATADEGRGVFIRVGHFDGLFAFCSDVNSKTN